MATNVLFCDLCNESVPQQDIDAKRARLVNGRVVCATCEGLMSAGFAPGAPRPAAVSPPTPSEQAAYGAKAPGAGPGPAGGAAANALTGQGPGAAPGRRRERQSVSGAALAMIAMLTALGIGWRLDRKFEAGQRGYDQALAKHVLQYQAAARDVRASNAALGDTSDALRASLAADVDELTRELRAETERWQTQSRETLDELRAFERELASFQQLAGLIDRHDKEMVGLQAKFAGLLDDLTRLTSRLGKLEQMPIVTFAEPANGSHGANAARGQAAEQRPRWHGLLGGLESPNADERWLAVDELGQAGDPAAAPFLVPMLRDEDTFVRMAAARILGALAAPVGIPALIDALEDSEGAVREAAMVALQSATGRDMRFDPHAASADRAKRVKAWRDWWAKEGEDFGG